MLFAFSLVSFLGVLFTFAPNIVNNFQKKQVICDIYFLSGCFFTSKWICRESVISATENFYKSFTNLQPAPANGLKALL
jgi:hypothetical protein